VLFPTYRWLAGSPFHCLITPPYSPSSSAGTIVEALRIFPVKYAISYALGCMECERVEGWRRFRPVSISSCPPPPPAVLLLLNPFRRPFLEVYPQFGIVLRPHPVQARSVVFSSAHEQCSMYDTPIGSYFYMRECSWRRRSWSLEAAGAGGSWSVVGALLLLPIMYQKLPLSCPLFYSSPLKPPITP
jgi:hypothetical protein